MGAVVEDTDVVIIGAGASGLAAIKQLTTTTELRVVCFEARSGPAGVWNPERKKGDVRVEFDGSGRPFVARPPIDCSPIYDGLRTNVPKQLMAFHGQPFVTEDPGSDFPPGHEVSRYLLEAARPVHSLIRFNSQVLRVSHPHPPPDLHDSAAKIRRWAVEVRPRSSSNTASQDIITVSCDFVLAASGHYSVPYVPFIPSLWTWPKEIIHACVYTNPSDPIFRHKTVAVIGIGPSGYDIIRELAMQIEKEQEGQSVPSTRAKKLYSVASHPAKMGWDFADPAAPSWTKLITSVPRFERLEGHKIWLVDGRLLEDVDLLCFATGYLYDFPFCLPNDPPWASHPLTLPPPTPPSLGSHPARTQNTSRAGFRVHHLDHTQLFFYPDPSFAFLVLHHQAVPFPLAEYQARAIAARWSGRKPFAIHPMEDEQTESKEVHALRPPREFEYENLLVDCIGEGGECPPGHECWTHVPAWKYKAREDTPANRRLELGY